MHVVDPLRYPLSSKALYRPRPHSLADADAFEATVGIRNMVLVQPSIYGYDNSCLLDALKELGPRRGRGVVVIDPDDIQVATLAHWHLLGVRGVRVNLRSVGRVMTAEELRTTLTKHANVIRPFRWAIQVYANLDMIPALESCVPELGVKLVIDHFGAPNLSPMMGKSSFDPYSLSGFSSLIRLLQAGQTYVKISASYRVSRDPGMRDIQVVAKELLRVARERVVYATDWPHTRFDGHDVRPFTEMCLDLCKSDQDLKDRLFRRNAESLWDVTH